MDSFMFEIQVPASSANLGPGFDSFGLAFKRYLLLKVHVVPTESEITLTGEGATSLANNDENLILRVARRVAQEEKFTLPPLKLYINNEIPLSRGLGSSSAAIIAGITIVEALKQDYFATEKFFYYALQFENHADNLAAARYGGFVLTCVTNRGEYLVLKQPWPTQLQPIVVIPDFTLDTTQARSVLPIHYSRADVVFNLQHALLLQAALAQGNLALLQEASRDRLHQPYRAPLVGGLVDALSLRLPGLHAVMLSGSGPSLLALATDNFTAISDALVEIFAKQKISAQATLLAIDQEGRKITSHNGSSS
jgi:homoserine kinase